jgi:hypothetical protein
MKRFARFLVLRSAALFSGDDMSTSARTDQRRFPPAVLVAAVLACVVLVGLGLLLAGLDDTAPQRAAETRRPASVTPAPEVQHASWQVRRSATGSFGKLTTAQSRRVRTHTPRIGALVKDVYDTLFLDPERTRRVVGTSFARPAARSWAKLRVGPPAGTTALRIVSRGAKVTVDAPSAKRAVATVRLRVQGQTETGRFRLAHGATLWLERLPGRWRVVAYTVDQRPVRR